VLHNPNSVIKRLDKYATNLFHENNIKEVGVLEFLHPNKTGEEWATLAGDKYTSQAITLAYNKTLDMIAVGLDTGLISIWKNPFEEEGYSKIETRLQVHKKRVTGVFFDAILERLISIGNDGFLRIVSLETLSPIGGILNVIYRCIYQQQQTWITCCPQRRHSWSSRVMDRYSSSP